MIADYPLVTLIPVSDLERARRFYVHVLGFKEFYEIPGTVMIEGAQGNLAAIYESPAAGQAQHMLASWSVDDLNSMMEDLKNRGVTFEDTPRRDIVTENGVMTYARMRMAFFRDTEGNLLSVTQLTNR